MLGRNAGFGIQCFVFGFFDGFVIAFLSFWVGLSVCSLQAQVEFLCMIELNKISRSSAIFRDSQCSVPNDFKLVVVHLVF